MEAKIYKLYRRAKDHLDIISLFFCTIYADVEQYACVLLAGYIVVKKHIV